MGYREDQEWSCIHAVPKGEEEQHWTGNCSGDCLCAPDVLHSNLGVKELGVYIIHNAFDGRESVSQPVMQ